MQKRALCCINVHALAVLTVKRQSQLQKTIFYYFFFIFQKKQVNISCESSAKQKIHMKCQDLFSLKKKQQQNSECHLLLILLGALRIKTFPVKLSMVYEEMLNP